MVKQDKEEVRSRIHRRARLGTSGGSGAFEGMLNGSSGAFPAPKQPGTGAGAIFGKVGSRKVEKLFFKHCICELCVISQSL